MSREPEFLIAAVRRFLHPDAPLPDHSEIDWDRLLWLASDHAVIPALCLALKDTPLPASISQELRSSFAASSRRSLAQAGQIIQLVSLFQENGIPAISLKGPPLSQYLYGSLGMRSSGDVDLLVRPGDVVGVRDLLTASGYRMATTLHWNADSAYLRPRENEISFADATGTLTVDIHWRIRTSYFATALDATDVWGALTNVRLGGQQIPTLAPEHLLLFLCYHAAKHTFARLDWICDIARFLMVTPNLDWPAIRSVAGRTRTSRHVLLSIRLAVELLGAPEPPDFSGNTAVERIVCSIRERLLSGAVGLVAAGEATRYMLAVLETPGQRIRFLAGVYLIPSEAEYRVLRLPPSLYFLYYPFRQIRLVAKHVFRCKRV